MHGLGVLVEVHLPVAPVELAELDITDGWTEGWRQFSVNAIFLHIKQWM